MGDKRGSAPHPPGHSHWSRPLATALVSRFVATITIASNPDELVAVRRLFGAYRRAVEDFASAADICA